jgi:hypothetical protein
MAAPPPPPGLDLSESQSNDIVVATAVTWGLATIAITLRFTARRIAHAKIWLDDYLILAAFVRRTSCTRELVADLTLIDRNKCDLMAGNDME